MTDRRRRMDRSSSPADSHHQALRWHSAPRLDRLQGNELVMTQELIANMLGVRGEGRPCEAALGRLCPDRGGDVRAYQFSAGSWVRRRFTALKRRLAKRERDRMAARI